MAQSVVRDADAGAAKPQRAVQSGRNVKPRGDVTGNALQAQKDALAEQRAREAAEQDAAIQAEQVQRRNTTIQIDYTGVDIAIEDPEPEDGELPERVTFIAKAGAEEMTYGIELNQDGSVRHGRPRTFNFKEGQRYEVPRDLYEHMDQRGLVWH